MRSNPSTDQGHPLPYLLAAGFAGALTISGLAGADSSDALHETVDHASDLMIDRSSVDRRVYDFRTFVDAALSLQSSYYAPDGLGEAEALPDPEQMEPADLLEECRSIYAQHAIDDALENRDLPTHDPADLDTLGDGCFYLGQAYGQRWFDAPPPFDQCEGVYSMDASDLPPVSFDFSGYDSEELSFLEACILIYQKRIQSVLNEDDPFKTYEDLGCRVEFDSDHAEATIFPPEDYEVCIDQTIDLGRLYEKAQSIYEEGGLKAILPLIQPMVLDKEMQSHLESIPEDLHPYFLALLEGIKTLPGDTQAICDSLRRAGQDDFKGLSKSDLPPLLGLLYKGVMEEERCDFSE